MRSVAVVVFLCRFILVCSSVSERRSVFLITEDFFMLLVQVVMTKSKKAFLKVSRKTSQGRSKQQKSINPFEIHTNKRKHDILGRRIKHERGTPGVSRSKAIKKVGCTLVAILMCPMLSIIYSSL